MLTFPLAKALCKAACRAPPGEREVPSGPTTRGEGSDKGTNESRALASCATEKLTVYPCSSVHILPQDVSTATIVFSASSTKCCTGVEPHFCQGADEQTTLGNGKDAWRGIRTGDKQLLLHPMRTRHTHARAATSSCRWSTFFVIV